MSTHVWPTIDELFAEYLLMTRDELAHIFLSSTIHVSPQNLELIDNLTADDLLVWLLELRFGPYETVDLIKRRLPHLDFYTTK